MARREHWWNLGEAQAIAVYRAKVISPVLFLWAATGLPFLMFPDMRQPEALSFIIGVWIAVLVAILILARSWVWLWIALGDPPVFQFLLDSLMVVVFVAVEPDVAVFKSSKAVNAFFRSVISAMPQSKRNPEG